MAPSKTELQEVLNTISDDLDRTVRFWLKHSHDQEYGGFFNCLTKEGRVFDTTKFGWLQGRQVWTYSALYHNFERFRKPEIRDAAVRGGQFLKNHFKDQASGKVFFTTSRCGKPIKMQRTIYAEVFYVMAFSGLARITGDKEYLAEAVSMFKRILHWVRVDDTGLGRPKFAGNAPCEALAVPMCVLGIIHEIEDVLPSAEASGHGIDLSEIRTWAVEKIKLHVQKDGKRILEIVTPDGKLIDGCEGRKMVPGHAIECGWFLLQESERTKNEALRPFAIEHFIENPYEYGTDKKFGGLFYFLDVDELPPTNLEWDMKLWWAHNETMIAFLMAFKQTGRSELWNKFVEVKDYCYDHFVDSVNGEWFGYLDRRGHVSIDFKGGPYKGCFHVPRTLMHCEKMLKNLIEKA